MQGKPKVTKLDMTIFTADTLPPEDKDHVVIRLGGNTAVLFSDGPVFGAQRPGSRMAQPRRKSALG